MFCVTLWDFCMRRMLFIMKQRSLSVGKLWHVSSYILDVSLFVLSQLMLIHFEWWFNMV